MGIWNERLYPTDAADSEMPIPYIVVCHATGVPALGMSKRVSCQPNEMPASGPAMRMERPGATSRKRRPSFAGTSSVHATPRTVGASAPPVCTDTQPASHAASNA